MIFLNTAVEGVQRSFSDLERAMFSIGFVRESWDYHQVVYDHEFVDDRVRYYLRLHGDVIGKRRLENPRAELVLRAPVLARHYFPHGLDTEAVVPAGLREVISVKMQEMERAVAGVDRTG
ncbi:YugN family protein [Pasteuria penetrans]|uniref:YugN family protein n=1 Tax=Pasteuria penetrans TaxID=86005 RepID=UPI000FA08B7E|nr:YugN family protein [Pasteuria penetrans]